MTKKDAFHTEDGKLIIISGASRTGKTAYTRKAIAKLRRVFVWDVEDQFSTMRGYKRVTKRAELLELSKKSGAVKVAFVAGGDLKDDFNFFCHCVRFAGTFRGPLAAVVEELADVTTPNKAPGEWGKLVRRGLKRGITIFAISQRWAEADKTAFGNSSEQVIFRCSSGDDVRYLARKTRIPESMMDDLRDLDFIKRIVSTNEVEASRLRF